MPQLDTPLLFDLLLGVVVLLFVPFGIRRGVAKEAMVSAGLLFGAAIAAAWLDPAAAWLIREWQVAPDVARFAMTAAGLAGGILILGYGGGAALGRYRPGLLARLAGGLLAACNGALLLSLLLRAIDRELQPGPWLEDGLLSRILLRDDDWLLLGIAALLALCVLLGLFVTAFRGSRQPAFVAPLPAESPPGAAPVPPRQRPIRFSRDDDAGKFEPTPDHGPDRFAPNLGQTAPLADRPILRHSPGAPWISGSNRPLRSHPPANGHVQGHTDGATAPIADDWLRRRAGSNQADSSAGRRCPRCGAPARSTDVFCPECGQTL